MGIIEGIWVRNFKSLKQVGVGSCYKQFVYVEDDENLYPFALNNASAFVGRSGAGKSSFFDALLFLSECFQYGVNYACQRRGGFDAIYSHGSKGPLSIGLRYRQDAHSDESTYALSISCTKDHVPYIECELLTFYNESYQFPVFFLQNGVKAIRYLDPDVALTNEDHNKIEFTDFNRLGLSALESHPRHPVVKSLRQLISNLLFVNFATISTKKLDTGLPVRLENPRGRSLSSLLTYMYGHYRGATLEIFKRVVPFLPDTESILIEIRGKDKQPTLCFKLKGREKIIPVSMLSEATLRLFAYALLMKENQPAPLIAIEEPEFGLDHNHLCQLSTLLHHVNTTEHPFQMFLTSQNPMVGNAVNPEQVWLFELDTNGFTSVQRASDCIEIDDAVKSGETLEDDWFTKYLAHRYC